MLESGQSGSLQYLLDCGGDSNLADKLGRAPLHVVAKMGDVDAATLLLERDARIDAVEMVCVCVCMCMSACMRVCIFVNMSLILFPTL